MTDDHARMKSIVADYPKHKALLVDVLLEIKAQTGSITEEAVRIVSDRLGLGVIDVQGVASFFSGFERHPQEERSRKRPSKAFDPWGEPPCSLWHGSR